MTNDLVTCYVLWSHEGHILQGRVRNGARVADSSQILLDLETVLYVGLDIKKLISNNNL